VQPAEPTRNYGRHDKRPAVRSEQAVSVASERPCLLARRPMSLHPKFEKISPNISPVIRTRLSDSSTSLYQLFGIGHLSPKPPLDPIIHAHTNSPNITSNRVQPLRSSSSTFIPCLRIFYPRPNELGLFSLFLVHDTRSYG